MTNPVDYRALLGSDRQIHTATAPGRINLIGEHTDYNGGFVFPMAIDRKVTVAASPRADRIVRVGSIQTGQSARFALDSLVPLGTRGWQAYVEGVAWSLQQLGLDLVGTDMVIGSDLPMGAGLSSSAALELAVARAMIAAAGLEWNADVMVRAAQRAEQEYVGVPCGIMDQFASAMSREGTAFVLDCRSLECNYVAIPDDASIIVLDTGARRTLGNSAYARRVQECAAAVAAIRRRHPEVRSLRDVDAALLSEHKGEMDAVSFRRAEHIIGETRRPLQMASCLADQDIASAGALMLASHASLRDLHQVSCVELDWMVECAMRHESCHGARMTGAGFGGCAIALVTRGAEAGFIRSTLLAYAERISLPANGFPVSAAGGARLADSAD